MEEITLFEGFRDPQDQSGVFVLYVPPDAGVPISEHVDLIVSFLRVQIADRKALCSTYASFIRALPGGTYIRFRARIATDHPHVSLRTPSAATATGGGGGGGGGKDFSSPHVRRILRRLAFSDVEAWDPRGTTPTLPQLVQHFRLPRLSTVVQPHHSPIYRLFNDIPPANPIVLF